MTVPFPAASVLITTYNNPAYLRLALLGYGRQTRSDFEIVVCDDGSGPETAEAVREVRERLPVPVSHVRVEDRGYRRGTVLNRGAAAARGGILVFTDQDCIPHREFVSEHVRCGGRGIVGWGRVVRLGQDLSEEVDERRVESGWLEGNPFRLLRWAARRRARAVEAGLYLGKLPLLRNIGRPFHQLFGGNFSCAGEDFAAANGFDERIEGWGREDTELGWRFKNAGFRFRNLKFRAILYHLWHRPQPRPRLEENERLVQETIASGRVRCERGLADHLDAAGGEGRAGP